MKALTLTEPWASLVAIGAKRIETRSWRTYDTGQRIAIHAAKGITLDDIRFAQSEPATSALSQQDVSVFSGWHKWRIKDAFKDTRGCVIATATLIECAFIVPDGVIRQDGRRVELTEQERAFGGYTPGRYAWILEDVIRLPQPIPAKGALSLWEWDPPAELRRAS